MSHRRRSRDGARTEHAYLGRAVVTAIIVAALALQAAASSGAFVRVLGLSHSGAWPFIDYALFREAHYPGETIDTWVVRARSASGQEIELSPLGVDWVMGVRVHNLTDALADGEPERVRRWCETYAEHSGDPLVSLELFEIQYLLGRDGFTRTSYESIGDLSLDPLAPMSKWPLRPGSDVR